jgi:curved DNA-binding protein CbpA
LSEVTPGFVARLLRRRRADHIVDYYELMGLDPAASVETLKDAYGIMRDQYLRVPDSHRRLHLLSLLDRAYAVLSDSEERNRYDAGRSNPSSASSANRKVRPASDRPKAKKGQATSCEEDPGGHQIGDSLDGVSGSMTTTKKDSMSRTAAPGQSITRMRRAAGRALRFATTKLRIPQVSYRQENSISKNGDERLRTNARIDRKAARRRILQEVDAEEIFLGRLESRVQGEADQGHPDSKS